MPPSYLTQPNPTASGHLVWTPGQDGPAAITHPQRGGESLTGTMLMVAAGVEADQLSVYEDGFMLMARTETWARIRAALIAGEELEESLPGYALRIVQLAEGWDRYEPAGGARADMEIVLLTPTAQVEAAIGAEARSAYILALQGTLGDLEGVVVRVVLQPNELPQVATKGPVPEALGSALASIEAPAVGQPLAFELHKGVLASEP